MNSTFKPSLAYWALPLCGEGERRQIAASARFESNLTRCHFGAQGRGRAGESAESARCAGAGECAASAECRPIRRGTGDFESHRDTAASCRAGLCTCLFPRWMAWLSLSITSALNQRWGFVLRGHSQRFQDCFKGSRKNRDSKHVTWKLILRIYLAFLPPTIKH